LTRQIVVDANVFVSFLVDRNEKQRSMAKALLESAAVVTQFAVFEISYVLQSFYSIPTAHGHTRESNHRRLRMRFSSSIQA